MTDSFVPFRLCCGQRHHGPQCPDGLVMCCMCFDRFPMDELYLDPTDGKRVDMCQRCHVMDEVAVERWWDGAMTCRLCSGLTVRYVRSTLHGR